MGLIFEPIGGPNVGVENFGAVLPLNHRSYGALTYTNRVYGAGPLPQVNHNLSRRGLVKRWSEGG